jgi:hypothetical protein
VKRVQELEADVSHLIRTRREPLSVLDGKPDAVDGDTRLVRHLELYWRGPGVRPGFNQLKDLFREFAFHICAVQGFWLTGILRPLSFLSKNAPDASERRRPAPPNQCRLGMVNRGCCCPTAHVLFLGA